MNFRRTEPYYYLETYELIKMSKIEFTGVFDTDILIFENISTMRLIYYRLVSKRTNKIIEYILKNRLQNKAYEYMDLITSPQILQKFINIIIISLEMEKQYPMIKFAGKEIRYSYFFSHYGQNQIKPPAEKIGASNSFNRNETPNLTHFCGGAWMTSEHSISNLPSTLQSLSFGTYTQAPKKIKFPRDLETLRMGCHLPSWGLSRPN